SGKRDHLRRAETLGGSATDSPLTPLTYTACSRLHTQSSKNLCPLPSPSHPDHQPQMASISRANTATHTHTTNHTDTPPEKTQHTHTHTHTQTHTVTHTQTHTDTHTHTHTHT